MISAYVGRGTRHERHDNVGIDSVRENCKSRGFGKHNFDTNYASLFRLNFRRKNASSLKFIYAYFKMSAVLQRRMKNNIVIIVPYIIIMFNIPNYSYTVIFQLL